MLPSIHLAAELPAPPSKIFSMYLDRRAHSTMTGAAARIAPRVGSAWSAFGGQLKGMILHLVPGRLIVQSWRSSDWKSSDLDSIVVLTLHAKGRKNTLVELIQVNVPQADFAGVSQGWEKYYWAPWREALTA